MFCWCWSAGVVLAASGLCILLGAGDARCVSVGRCAACRRSLGECVRDVLLGVGRAGPDCRSVFPGHRSWFRNLRDMLPFRAAASAGGGAFGGVGLMCLAEPVHLLDALVPLCGCVRGARRLGDARARAGRSLAPEAVQDALYARSRSCDGLFVAYAGRLLRRRLTDSGARCVLRCRRRRIRCALRVPIGCCARRVSSLGACVVSEPSRRVRRSRWMRRGVRSSSSRRLAA